jgi:hypothetical protein
MRCPDIVKCLASHFRIPVSHLSAVRRTGGKKSTCVEGIFSVQNYIAWQEVLVNRNVARWWAYSIKKLLA